MTGRTNRRPWARAGRWAVRACLIVGVLVAAAWLLRGPLIHPWVIARLERYADERLDAELEVGALRSNWFGGARLEGVRWSAGSGALRGLEAPRVELRWSLLGLVAGSESWLRSIEGRVDSVSLAAAPAPATQGEPFTPPAHLPRVDLSLGQLSYALDAERTFEVGESALRVEADRENDGERGTLEIATLALRARTEDGAATIVAANEPTEVTLTYAGGRLKLADSRLGEWLALEGGEVDLSRAGQVSWSLGGEALRGSLSSSGKVVDGRVDASFSGAGLAYAALAELLDGRAPELPPELEPEVTVNGRLRPAGPDGLTLELDWLEARTSALLLRGVDLKTGLGAEDWRGLVRDVGGRVLVEAADPGTDADAEGSGRPPLDLALTAELEGGRAELGGRIRTEGGNLEITRGELRLESPPGGSGGPGAAGWLAELVADLDLEASFTDLEPLGSALGLDWSGALEGRVEISGPVLEPTGRMTATASDVRALAFELGEVDLDLIARDGRVELIDCEVLHPSWSASAKGAWVAGERRLEGVSVELAGGGLALGPIEPAELRLSLAADGPLDALTGAYSIAGSDLGLAGFEQLGLRGAGTFEGRTVQVDSLLAEDGALALRAAGAVTVQDGGDFVGGLEDVELSGPEGTWRMIGGGAPAPFARTGGELHVGPLELESRVDANGATRTGSAELLVKGSAFEGRFDHFELGPLDPRLRALVEGLAGWELGPLTGELAGSLDAGERNARFDLAVERVAAVHAGQRLERGLVCEGALAPDGRLTVAVQLFSLGDPGDPGEIGDAGPGGLRLELDAPAAFDDPGPVTLTVASGALELAEIGPLAGLPPGSSGRLELDADLRGSWSDLRGAIRVRGDGLSSPEVRAALDGDLAVAAELDCGERVELVRGDVNGPDGHLVSATGSLGAALDVAGWTRDPGALLDAPLALACELDLPLEGWTQRIEGVRSLAGAARGRLELNGTPRGLAPDGTLTLSDVELRLNSAVPSIRALNADLAFDGRRAEIASMELEFGGAPCTVTGAASWDGGLRLEDVELRGQNLLIARSSTTKLRADLAPITLDGPLDALFARGAFVITEGRFAQDVDLLANLVPGSAAPKSSGRRQEGFRPSFARSGPLASMRFEVDVRSKGALRVKGNLYDLTLRPDVTLRGTGQVPLFDGAIYVDPSTLSLPSGRLGIDSGVLRFSRDDPFRPNLALSAGMESKGYDIDARIDGPLGDPEIMLTSTPALPNDQLLMLFLAGQTPSTSNQGLAAAQTVGVFLAQDALVRWLGGGTKEADSVLDNLVFEIGADVSHTGAPTLVGRYFLDPRRRRTGRTTYLIAEKDVWDRTNFGFGIRFRFR